MSRDAGPLTRHGRCGNGELEVYCFCDGDYERVGRSGLLPGLDLEVVAGLADHPYTSEVLDRFEAELDTTSSR